MLKLSGQVVNVFKAPDFKKDENTTVPGGHKVQLMSELPLKNGETKMELVTLTVKNPDQYAIGETADIPVGYMVKGTSVTFFSVDR